MFKYPLNLNNYLITYRKCPVYVSHQLRNNHNGKTTTAAATAKTFQDMVKMRQDEAKRSVFIEAPGNTKSINDLTEHCSRYGTINNIFRHDVEKRTFFLVEFANIQTANHLIKSVYHPGNHFIDGRIRPKSRFISFSATNGSGNNRKNLLLKQENNTTDHQQIIKEMRKETSNDNQITKLWKVNRLSDLSSRLRFLTGLQIEEAISGVFYNPQVLPFGSSVNGFGQLQSDLDMILLSHGNRRSNGSFTAMPFNNLDEAPRTATRNNLFILSTLLRHWIHGASEISPILNARVPIIKYSQTLTYLDCDLSMSNISGYQMSEIFYTFGQMDVRVKPFVFYIRTWAKQFEVLQSYPQTNGLSNFMITCLAIFYLQQLKEPILPPAEDFIRFRELNDGNQSSTDLSKLRFKTQNTSQLIDLVTKFFEYYSTFDFNANGTSISAGCIKANIVNDSMYIYNPLDQTVNVSRNVSDFERNAFVDKCRIAHEALTTGNLSAADLLEFYNKKTGQSKIDRFINNVTSSKPENTSNTKKFHVRSIMKTR